MTLFKVTYADGETIHVHSDSEKDAKRHATVVGVQNNKEDFTIDKIEEVDIATFHAETRASEYVPREDIPEQK